MIHSVIFLTNFFQLCSHNIHVWYRTTGILLRLPAKEGGGGCSQHIHNSRSTQIHCFQFSMSMYTMTRTLLCFYFLKNGDTQKFNTDNCTSQVRPVSLESVKVVMVMYSDAPTDVDMYLITVQIKSNCITIKCGEVSLCVNSWK